GAWNTPASDSAERHLNIAEVQQLEIRALRILAVQGVFVALAQEPLIVGALEIFNLGGIAPELFVVGPDSPRILHPPVNHLLFAIALDVKCDRRHDRRREDYQ